MRRQADDGLVDPRVHRRPDPAKMVAQNLPLVGDVTGSKATIEVPEGSTVDDLCAQLGIGDEGCVIMVNDAQHHRAKVLEPGDMVTFLPPLAGGRESN